MKRKIFTTVGTMIAVFGLVSCGSEFSESGGSDESTEPAVNVQEVDGQDDRNFFIIEKEVEEGQSVTCVVYDNDGGYNGQGGLSCNWDEYNEKHNLSEIAE